MVSQDARRRALTLSKGAGQRDSRPHSSLIYLDAFIPKDGQSLLELVPPPRAAEMLKLANEQGEGKYLPLAAAPTQHVTDPREAALLKDLCVPTPLATFTQKLKVSGDYMKVPKKAFVFANKFAPSPFARFAEEAATLGWPVEKLPTHHFTMISMPTETADVLMRHSF